MTFILAVLLFFLSHSAQAGESSTLAGYDLSLDYKAFQKRYEGKVYCEEKDALGKDQIAYSVRFGQCELLGDIRKKEDGEEEYEVIGYAAFYMGKIFRFVLNSPNGLKLKTAVSQLGKKGKLSYFKTEDPEAKGRYHTCTKYYGRPCQTCIARTPLYEGAAFVTGIQVSDWHDADKIFLSNFDGLQQSPSCETDMNSEKQAGAIIYSNRTVEKQSQADIEAKKKKADATVNKGFKL